MAEHFYYSIASGSSGNCGLYVSDGTAVLIDVGVSLRKLTAALAAFDMKPGELDALIITHEHIDHVKGLAMFLKKTEVPVFVSRGTAAALLRGCETVVLESNHDPHMLQAGPYPYALKQRVAGPNGHLSNPDCAVFAAFLADNGTRKLVLAHLSEKNNMPALALQQTKNALRGREGCTVCVAPRDCMESPVVLGEEGAACLVSG